MRPLEVTRSGILATMLVFVVAAVCIRLGLWQLERREQRLERNEAIAERVAEEPVVLERVPGDTTGLTYRQVIIDGRFDNARTVVLAGRSYAGAPGVHVLSPLETGQGALLVNRGWLPAPDAATVELEPVRLEGDVRVEGLLLPFPDVDVDRRATGFQVVWYRFDGDALRQQYPYPVAPLYIQATTLHAGAAVDSARAAPLLLPPPELDPGPHLSYAVQWFSFAVIFLIGWLALLARRSRREPGVSGSEGAAGG